MEVIDAAVLGPDLCQVGRAEVRRAGAPDLTQIGAENRGVDFFHRYVANPSEFGNTVMPQFQTLGDENLEAIGVFLDASKNP